MMLYRFPNLLLFLGAILTLGLASSCGEDDEMPMPQPEEAPVAAFTFAVSSSNVLSIEFTNGSTDAVSYAWDFGDGNNATDANPVHTYANAGAYTVQLTATNSEGTNSTSSSVTVQSPYRTSGYVLSSFLPSTGASTSYSDFFTELPNGDVDLTQAQSAPSQSHLAVHGAFFYGWPRAAGEFGIAKFAIDANTDELVEVGRINIINSQFRIVIINDELGFAASFSTLILTVFNPTTMTIIQEIDLAENTMLPEVDENSRRGVNGLYHNEVTGKLIVAVHFDSRATNQFYDLEDGFIEVVDVATLNRESPSSHPQAMYLRMNGKDNVVVDEAGNLYLVAQGSYGLDGNVGPMAPARSKPQILKIDAATSQFDTDYAWNPVEAAGFGSNFIQLFSGMIGTGSGKAYGICSAATDDPRLLQLLALFGQGMLDGEGFNELRNLVFASENARLTEIDLAAKTATPVIGSPLTAGYNYPYLYAYDGEIYHQVTSQAFNGYYVTNPTNNSTIPVANLSGGGFATSLIRLEE